MLIFQKGHHGPGVGPDQSWTRDPGPRVSEDIESAVALMLSTVSEASGPGTRPSGAGGRAGAAPRDLAVHPEQPLPSPAMRGAGKGKHSRGQAASSGHADLRSSVIAWLSPALSSPGRRRKCPDLGGRALASEEGTLGAASQVASPWQKLGTAPLSMRQTLGGAQVIPDFDPRPSFEALTACGQDMWSPLHSREPGSREVHRRAQGHTTPKPPVCSLAAAAPYSLGDSGQVVPTRCPAALTSL